MSGTVTRRRGMRGLLASIIGIVLLVGGAPVGAADAFAAPAFQPQWQQGEALAPNFWGPLATAYNGQTEPYQEAKDGKRLVQYFDKGRMELTAGALTNGLLATEMVRGQVQMGDALFQLKEPPAIPIAGDPTNPGPTYAMLRQRADQFLVPVSTRLISPIKGERVTVIFTVTGEIKPFPEGADYAPSEISLYDETTQHNVPRAFAAYRQRAGIASIGLAISEPFWTNPKVGGQNKAVLVQFFERRILTYTPVNAPEYQIEMGNIGQHYHRWRYGS